MERLRAALPELRKLEGFPIGSDDDVLALSDPPYYTACPNPFLAEFVARHGTAYDETSDDYRREPFAADISEGRNDPVYNAHSYHTKVPHKAIMRYILHYTKPGDVVFDGFCGTGMTGVAAQLCGSPDPDFRATVEAEWAAAGHHEPNGEFATPSWATSRRRPPSSLTSTTRLWTAKPSVRRRPRSLRTSSPSRMDVPDDALRRQDPRIRELHRME